jgi:predicted component of type VI protein secretion system
MKVNLVVAQGVHSGKIIPVGSSQFLIGRDAHCNLRPASPAISKQHCGILVRDGKVFVQDYGSTNGTSVNGEQVTGERLVNDGDLLKAGPLEFTIKIDSTSKSTLKAPAARTEVNSTTPAGVAETNSSVALAGSADDPEQAAALLLAMDESAAADSTAEVKIPDGTTIMDAPAVPGVEPGKPTAKPATGDTSKAAADILSKYMRRPRA